MGWRRQQKTLIIGLTAGACALAVWLGLGLRDVVVVTTDGTTHTAAKSWVIGSNLFLHCGDEIRVVERHEVERWVQLSIGRPETVWFLLRHRWQTGFTLVSGVSGLLSPASGQRHGRWLFHQRRAEALVGTAGLGILVWCFFKIHRLKSRRSGASMAAVAADANPLLPPLAGFADIQSLFLSVFAAQIGAFQHIAGHIAPAAEQSQGPRRVFDLIVKQSHELKKRRITIAPIGEDTGSKSQCFSVIFENHLVVKIPPTPIIELKDYIGKLQADRHIVRKLEPIVCVVPNLSIICKKLYAFPDADHLTTEQLEDRYVVWLKANPDFQRFLKIGGGFAFFMDLARFFFLSHVFESFHHSDDLCIEQIRSDAQAMTDVLYFDNKYGESAYDIRTDLDKVHKHFQEAMRKLRPTKGAPEELNARKTREWVVAHLTGRRLDAFWAEVPPDLKNQVRQCLKEAAAANPAAVSRYRELFDTDVNRRLFQRNRLAMGEMVTSLIALLTRLAAKQVAMRDLKPDNLLVAGKPSDYPHFLSSADLYTIGLIDLETAVDYQEKADSHIAQPQLGGTPLFATPSHFFDNKVLTAAHSNLQLVLGLQDWYAMVAIIYQLIVGKHLFARTARLIPPLLSQIRRAIHEGGDLMGLYLDISGRFWESAQSEFNQQVSTNHRRLEAIACRILPMVALADRAQESRSLLQMVQRLGNFQDPISVRDLLTVMFLRVHTHMLPRMIQPVAPSHPGPAAEGLEAGSAPEGLGYTVTVAIARDKPPPAKRVALKGVHRPRFKPGLRARWLRF